MTTETKNAIREIFYVITALGFFVLGVAALLGVHFDPHAVAGVAFLAYSRVCAGVSNDYPRRNHE